MGKYYFDEQEAQELIQKYKETTTVVNGTVISKNEKIENDLMVMIKKIVIAIINNYRYYIYEDYEDLLQAGLEACYKGILRYDPIKATSFNYFSLITKMHLYNYTTRRRKHRGHLDIEEQVDIEGTEEVNFNVELENLDNSLKYKIDRKFVRNKRRKYLKISVILIDYLEKSKRIINKSDLYAWCRSYGIKQADIREFFSEIVNSEEM
jgi:hypothetical protein